MIIRTRYIISAAATSAFLVFAPLAIAETNTSGSDHSTNTSTPTSDTSKTNNPKTNTTTETEKPKGTLQERIQKQKDTLKTDVTKLEQDRLKLRCKAAQGIVKGAGDRAGTGATDRVKAYDELQTHLTNIIAKLKALGISTTVLEQEQTTLVTKAAKIKTDFTTYKQDLADLKDMDCVTDPAGFKAALEATRIIHDNLTKEIADIKTYVTGTIKPTLQQLRDQVKAKESTTTTGGNQ